MRLEIQEQQTGVTHTIDEGGALLGRDGNRCDIVVVDKGVSNQHARIYGKDGRWFIEDRGSSNGTFVGEQRIRGAVELVGGAEFRLFRQRFVVVNVHTGSAATGPLDRREVPETAETGAMLSGSVSRTIRGESLQADDGPVAATVLAAMGKAVAYLLASVPRLALAPRSFVEDGIDSYEVAELRAWEIVGWTLPIALLAAAVSLVAGLGAAVVSGSFALFVLVTPVLTALIAGALGALIVGFLFHPLVHWLVRVLGGNSNALSRSNMLVATLTAGALAQLAAAAAVGLGLLQVPFVGLLGQLLTLGATLLTLYVAHAWWRHLEVGAWIGVVFLALAGLSAYGSLHAMYGSAQASLARLEVPAAPAEADGAAEPTAATSPTPNAPPVDAAAAAPSGGPAVSGRTPYADYVKKRDAVESAIANDPTLLTRVADVLSLYKKLHQDDARFASTRGAKDDAVAERLYQAKLYEATVTTVDALFEKAIVNPTPLAPGAAPPSAVKARKHKGRK